MSSQPFSDLRAGRSGCPSDLALDRFQAEELPKEQAEQIRAHAASCSACSQHLRQLSFQAHPDVNEAAMLARIRQRLEEPRGLLDRLRGLLSLRSFQWMTALGTAAGAALVLVALRLSPGDDQGAAQDVRSKGGLSLHVHRMTRKGSEEVLSGARLAAGDSLRFVVDLPREGYVAIIGIEQDGDLYTAWPLDRGGNGPAEMRRPAGSGQLLPGAVALDDTPGRETLHLVHCPLSAGPPVCRSLGAYALPACQRGCVLTPFAFSKGTGR